MQYKKMIVLYALVFVVASTGFWLIYDNRLVGNDRVAYSSIIQTASYFEDIESIELLSGYVMSHKERVYKYGPSRRGSIYNMVGGVQEIAYLRLGLTYIDGTSMTNNYIILIIKDRPLDITELEEDNVFNRLCETEDSLDIARINSKLNDYWERDRGRQAFINS